VPASFEDQLSVKARCDASERLRRVHQAAAHDKRFQEQVAQGVKEADDPNTRWVTNDQAKAGWAAKRADLVKRAKGRAA
jgi:hypothetical protein